MSAAQLEQVRRFNRIVSERLGALEDRYLARERALGEARVLWEIAAEGSDVRELRARLGLDSGYLSRLLRALEAAGLVAVGPGGSDARVRRATLTTAGRRERRLLDQRSNELARSLLAPLDGERRGRLVAAMAEVERLLTAGLVEMAVVDPGSAAAGRCLEAYFVELRARFPQGFDPHLSLVPDARELGPPSGLFVLATLRGIPVGCGGLRFHDGGRADIKRMWVDREVRGLGVGRRLLAELERQARAHGVHLLRLETNRTLSEAIALYRSAGYTEVEPFNDERYADHWFAKPLGGEALRPS